MTQAALGLAKGRIRALTAAGFPFARQ